MADDEKTHDATIVVDTALIVTAIIAAGMFAHHGARTVGRGSTSEHDSNVEWICDRATEASLKIANDNLDGLKKRAEVSP